MEKIASQITHWIKTYAENARVKGLVIGVSGGGGLGGGLYSLCAYGLAYSLPRNAYTPSGDSRRQVARAY